MRITEKDKLEWDLAALIDTRRRLDEARKALGWAKRLTRLWLHMRLTKLIGDIDQRIGAKKKEIALERAFEETADGKVQKPGAGAGERSQGADPAGNTHAAAADRGHDEAYGEQKHQRTGAEAGIRAELEQLGTVRGAAAGGAAGGGTPAVNEETRENPPAGRTGKHVRITG